MVHSCLLLMHLARWLDYKVSSLKRTRMGSCCRVTRGEGYQRHL